MAARPTPTKRMLSSHPRFTLVDSLEAQATPLVRPTPKSLSSPALSKFNFESVTPASEPASVDWTNNCLIQPIAPPRSESVPILDHTEHVIVDSVIVDSVHSQQQEPIQEHSMEEPSPDAGSLGLVSASPDIEHVHALAVSLAHHIHAVVEPPSSPPQPARPASRSRPTRRRGTRSAATSPSGRQQTSNVMSGLSLELISKAAIKLCTEEFEHELVECRKRESTSAAALLAAQADLQSARDEIQSARDECQLWKTSIVRALDPNLDASALSAIDVAEQIESVVVGLRNLRSEFEHQQALHAQLESDSVQIAASKAAMDAAREAMQAEVQAIRDEMTEVRLQADDQKSFLQKRITELQSELVVVSAAGTERAAQLAAQHAELSHQRDLQIEELQTVVDQLSIAARQADGDRQAALEQSKSWQEQAQQGERRLTEIQLQKAQLQAECEHSSIRLRDIESKFQQQAAEIDQTVATRLEALVQASSIHLQELTVQSADRERTIEELKAQLSASDAIRNMEQAAHLSVMRAHDSTVTELEAKWQSMELKLALAVDQGTRSAASAVEYQASAVERAERLAREAQTRSIALENELIQTRVATAGDVSSALAAEWERRLEEAQRLVADRNSVAQAAAQAEQALIAEKSRVEEILTSERAKAAQDQSMLQAEIAALQAAHETESTNQNHAHANSLSALQAQLSAVEIELQASRMEFDRETESLKSQMEIERANAASTLASERARFELEFSTIQQQSKAECATCSTVQSQLQFNADHFQSKIDEMRSEHQKLLSSIKEQQRTHDAVAARLVVVEAEREALQASLSRLENDSLNARVELQSKLDVALSALEDHNSNDSKSLSHATDAIERLSDALKHEEAKHMHDVQHLQRDIEAARHQIAQKSEESSQQVKKYGDLAFTLDNRTQELHRALEQCVALERAKMQIDDELEALRNKVVELQEQLQFSASKGKQYVDQQAVDFQKEMEKFDKVVAHNTLLSEQLAEMQQKISNFTTSKSVFDQIEEENKRLKEEVAAAADLMAMGERATAEIERLRGELEKRRKVENELCELGDEAATELNRLRAELKHIKSMQK